MQQAARCALLVDRNGQLVATVGETPQFDPTAFASLTAADFSANDQLAKMIGEAEFASLVHQGERESMFLADVAKRFSDLDITPLGLSPAETAAFLKRETERWREVIQKGNIKPD